MTGCLIKLNKFFSKLVRGIRYFRFILNLKKNNLNFFDVIDFLSNRLFFLIDNRFKKNFINNNYFLFKITNLDFFANIRLTTNFYTGKLDNTIYIYFFFKSFEKNFNYYYYLNQFKLY
jgi:hypothetical protein